MVKGITGAEKKGYVNGALDLSREKVESAIDAYKRKNYGQVLSSLYYSYFHIIKAVLYQKGFDPKSHEGVYTLLNLHFIKPDVLDKKYSRFFERLHKNREIADYNAVAPKFDREDADTFMKEFAELIPGIFKSFRNFKARTDIITKRARELKGLI